jgi:hypothetical protein
MPSPGVAHPSHVGYQESLPARLKAKAGVGVFTPEAFLAAAN